MRRSRRLWLPAALVALAAATIALAPQSAELQTLRNQGKALFEELRFGEAAAVFARAAEAEDAGPRDYLNLAATQYRNGDDDAALATLERFATSLGDNPGAPFLRGLIARRRGDPEAARAALERARELDPTDPAIRYHLGAVYAQLDATEEALAEFAVVEEMGFDIAVQHYVSSVYQSMQILLRQGRRDAAEPLVEMYRQTNPRLTEAARAPGALDLSRWTAITVPAASVAPANPASAAVVRLAPVTGPALPVDGAAGRLGVGDLDGDRRPDLVITGEDGAVWLSDGDEYRRSPLATPRGPVGIGDYDRDGLPDLYVASRGGDRLYRNDGADFAQVETADLGVSADPAAVTWVDYDHDGDLDVLVTGGAGGDAAGGVAGEASSSTRLLRNQGSDLFVDVTAEAGLPSDAEFASVVFADFDADFDVDLLFWGPAGTRLYTNLRGGRFDDIGGAIGARIDAAVRDVVAEDLDNDGGIDLALATDEGVELRRNLPGGTFLAAAAGDLGAIDAERLAAADFNNDGYLDLVVVGSGDLRFFANAGGFRFVEFAPLPAGQGAPFGARAPATGGADGGSRPYLSAADLNADGAVDLIVARGDAMSRLQQPSPVASWLAVDLTGIKNNVQGIGARVEVKAGGAYQLRPLRDTLLHFGLGDAVAAEVVRVRWPNGIIQNLLDAAGGQVHAITELERLEGSCPFLYTWDGSRFRFANEVLGSSPLGMLLAEGVYHQPDGDEYAFVAGEHLRPRDGFYEIRVTEELRETSYIDAARLLVVDHPEDWTVVPDEGFGGPARPDLRLHLYDELLPVRGRDQEGRDWTAALEAVDGYWASPFEPDRYDGLATEHALTLELPAAAGAGDAPVQLYLTGWVYWSMGSVNLAVDQDPTAAFLPVSLEVPDGSGGWRVAIEDIGLPIAKNTTLVTDVSGVLVPDDPRVRLRTTMRLYWDAIGYTVGGDWAGGVEPAGDWRGAHGVPVAGTLGFTGVQGATAPVRVEVLEAAAADLRPRGFSAIARTPDGYETFDYETVVPTAPWEQHRGFYTRFGAVGELLAAADDRYVVLATGDEIAIRFPAVERPLPDGWRRDYLVYLNGWLKDTDVNSRWGDRVAPLPFQAMSGYPYPPSEAYPDTTEHREFLQRYLTRPPRPINPPLGGGR